MNCLKCNKEFTPKRADAKFCSDTCRKYYVRHNHVSDLNVRDNETLDVRDNSVVPPVVESVGYPAPTLLTTESEKTYTDHCHFCDHKFGKAPDGEQLLGWICADCASKASRAE